MECLNTFLLCIFLLFTLLVSAHNLSTQFRSEYGEKKMERLIQKVYQKSQNFKESVQFLQHQSETPLLESNKNKDIGQKSVSQNTELTNIQQNKFFSLSLTPSVKVAQLSVEQFYQKYMKDIQTVGKIALGQLAKNNPPQSTNGSGLVRVPENDTKSVVSLKLNSSTQKKQSLPGNSSKNISVPQNQSKSLPSQINSIQKQNSIIKLNQSLKQGTIQNSSTTISRTVTQNMIQQSKNITTVKTENSITITQKSSVSTTNSENVTSNKLFDNLSVLKRKKNEKKEVATTEFEGVGLYQIVPIVFVEGQIYKFNGVVLNASLVAPQGSVKINFITVIFSDQTGQNQFKCSQELEANLTFEMSCKMQKSGIYYLSIFAGLYGQSTVRPRNILRPSRTPLVSFSEPPKPQNVHMEIINNNLYVIWDSVAGLTNLTIYQQNGGQIKSKQYLLSNFHDKFKLPLLDFKQFQAQTTYVEVSHAQSSDGSLAFIESKFGLVSSINFKASQHAFKQYFEELISTPTELPWRVNVGDKITFNVTFKDNIKNLAYVVEPDLNIRRLYLSKEKFPTDVIRAGTFLSIQILFNKQGTNILQINSVSGMAVINRPIYVGQSYPLLPDYRDEAPLVMIFKPNQLINSGQIYENYYQKTTQKINKNQPPVSSSIQQKRQYLLTLLNGLRRKYRVDPVELSQELNKIAQFHSDDMAQNNYFSHNSPNGDGPGERAKKMGFMSSIGENIAQARYLTEAHLGLQRSAGHLENSVGKGWVRVGIGISRSNNNDYFVCFEFSSRDFKRFPLTPEQEQRIKKDLFKVVKEKNPTIVKQNEQLSSDIEQWMQLGKDSKMLEQILRKNNYYGPIIASSFTFSSTEGWQDRLSQADFLDVKQNFKEIGTGLKTADDRGNLEGVIIFA